MKDFNLKKSVMEPKIYCVLVKSIKGRALHLGVHFSLDEAYVAAKKVLDSLTPHVSGESIDIDLWRSMEVREALIRSIDSERGGIVSGFISEGFERVAESDLPEDIKTILGSILNTTIVEGDAKPDKVPPFPLEYYIEDVKLAKNDLIKKLIEAGDATRVENIGSTLTAHEKRFVLKKISEKTPNKATKDKNVDNTL